MLRFVSISLVILLLSANSLILCHKHSSHPLMLLVSFDGFRWDYLKRFNLTNFNKLKEMGSHADYIYNSFATATFPNHWTIVTGMFEEDHGIVHNEIFDPLLNDTFESGTVESRDHKWYGQNPQVQPIWITNQKAGDGRKSAASWVGGGVEFGGEKAKYIVYDKDKKYDVLIDEFIGLFTSDEGQINFGAMYFDEPDRTGHLYGPYSPQMEAKLSSLDKTLGYLIDQLQSHHLFDKLNLIITSDHGMEQITQNKTIYLDSYVDTSLFKAYGRPASYNLFLRSASDLERVFTDLAKAEHIYVYRKKDIPDSLHYRKNVRIGDLVIIARLGYQIVLGKEVKVDWSKHNHGEHGYLNNQSSMYPIFISHGPAFKKNYKIKSFLNVDIYPLMCLLLGVTPANSNGHLANVLDMVNYHPIEISFSYVYLLILLVPLSLILVTFLMFCLCRSQNKGVDSTLYEPVGQHELLIRNSNFQIDDE